MVVVVVAVVDFNAVNVRDAALRSYGLKRVTFGVLDQNKRTQLCSPLQCRRFRFRQAMASSRSSHLGRLCSRQSSSLAVVMQSRTFLHRQATIPEGDCLALKESV